METNLSARNSLWPMASLQGRHRLWGLAGLLAAVFWQSAESPGVMFQTHTGDGDLDHWSYQTVFPRVEVGPWGFLAARQRFTYLPHSVLDSCRGKKQGP